MIYSAAHKKSESAKRSTGSSAAASSASTGKSTGSNTGASKTTGSAPATPRKSSRTKAPTTPSNNAGAISYAAAAAEEPASDNEVVEVKPSKTPRGAATPRRSGRISTVTREELAGNGGSPMRMTRSRSKGRGLGESETDD
jgi:N-acetylmuramoyl-L-alanine amidase CwlA